MLQFYKPNYTNGNLHGGPLRLLDRRAERPPADAAGSRHGVEGLFLRFWGARVGSGAIDVRVQSKVGWEEGLGAGRA